MLNNSLRLFLTFCILAAVFAGMMPHLRAQAQTETPTPTSTPVMVKIFSPSSGEAVQGSISIPLIADMLGLIRAELYFGYSGDPTNTWFLLALFQEPVRQGTQVLWDTTLISDGDYDLYLVVTSSNGSTLTDRVERVRVRNYSPIETETPAPTLTPAPGDLPTATSTLQPSVTPIPPTSTPLPPNPAEITPTQALTSLGIGAAAAVGALGLLGVYLAFRRMLLRK